MKEPPISDPKSAQRVETGIEFIRQGMSACEQLDDATDEELFAQLRTSDAHIRPDGYDIEEITLYAAAIFTLKHRGYETHTEDGVIFVTDEDGDVVYEEQYRSE